MRLFFKHIVRTVRSSPTQPILVLLTIILSVAIGITSFKISNVFFVRTEDISSSEAMLGDITVTASADRDIGILFDTDAQNAVGDRADVLGIFELVALVPSGNGMTIINTAAVDVVAADRYFSFDYYEYGSFTTENIESSVLISKDFADKMMLTVGDTITVSLLDEKLDLTVQAIAENNGLLENKDMLFPMERVVSLLSGKSAFIASLGDDFMPYNKLLIKCEDANGVDEVASILSEHEKMQNCVVALTADSENASPFALFQTVAVSMLAFTLLLLALLLMLTSQSLMRKQRTLEFAQFSAAGASDRQIVSMQLMENLLYAIIGATIGILISPFMLRYTLEKFEWEQYNREIGLSGILLGYGVAIILAVSATLIAAKKDGKKDLALKLNENSYPSAPRLNAVTTIFCGCICLISVVAALLLKVNVRYCALIVSTVSLVIFVYLASPYLYKALMSAAEKATARFQRGMGVFAIAIKSIKNNYSLRHTGRLLCVVFSLIFTISVSANTFSRQYKLFDGMIEGQIMTTSVNARVEGRLKNNSDVEGVTRIRSNTVVINDDYNVFAVNFSGDADKCISKDFLPDKMPQEGEIVIAYGVAKLLGVEIGDTVKVSAKGSEKILTVCDIWDLNVGAALIEDSFASSWSSVYNIKLHDDKLNESYGDTVAFLESQGVGVLEDNDVIGMMDTLSGFDYLITAVVILTVMLSCVGLLNVISECIRSRKRERELLIQSGLEPRGAIALHAIEIGIIAVIAAVVGIVCGYAICLILHYLIHSFGYTLFYF